MLSLRKQLADGVLVELTVALAVDTIGPDKAPTPAETEAVNVPPLATETETGVAGVLFPLIDVAAEFGAGVLVLPLPLHVVTVGADVAFGFRDSGVRSGCACNCD